MTQCLPYTGLFINLDRARERRAAMEAELARYGLSYTRFPGVDGASLGFPNPHLSPGVMGCFSSHYKLLRDNLATETHLHVMEDDVLLCPGTVPAIRRMIESGRLDAYDIIFTDVSVPLRNEIYKSYKAAYDKAVRRGPGGKIASVAFDVLDMKTRTYSSTGSFLVNKKSIRKLHDLFEAELKAGARAPIDLMIRQMNYDGVLKVGCVFPFVTAPRLEGILDSGVDPGSDRRHVLAAEIARYAFLLAAMGRS